MTYNFSIFYNLTGIPYLYFLLFYGTSQGLRFIVKYIYFLYHQKIFFYSTTGNNFDKENS